MPDTTELKDIVTRWMAKPVGKIPDTEKWKDELEALANFTAIVRGLVDRGQ